MAHPDVWNHVNLNDLNLKIAETESDTWSYILSIVK